MALMNPGIGLQASGVAREQSFRFLEGRNFQILSTGESFGIPPERFHDVISQMPRGR
jgi:hypothetical protein